MRYYSRTQVEQLKLINALLGQGYSIGQIIHNTRDELERVLVAQAEKEQRVEQDGVSSVVLVGRELYASFVEEFNSEGKAKPKARSTSRLTCIEKFTDTESFLEESRGHLDQLADIDGIVVYQNVVDLEEIGELRSMLLQIKRQPKTQLAVMHEFATRADRAELASLPGVSLFAMGSWQKIASMLQDVAGQVDESARSISRTLLTGAEIEQLREYESSDEVVQGADFARTFQLARSLELLVEKNGTGEFHEGLMNRLRQSRVQLEEAMIQYIEHYSLFTPVRFSQFDDQTES